MAFETIIKLPLVDGPKWLTHLEIFREGNEVVIQVVKDSGICYAETRLVDTDFNNMTDLVLTRSSMERRI